LQNHEKREIIINEIKQVFETHETNGEVTFEGYDTFCRSTIHVLINKIPFFMIKSMKFKIQNEFIEIWFGGKMISHFPINDILDFEI
jgi:hypothetical protein